MKSVSGLLVGATLAAQQFAPVERNHFAPDPGATVALVALDVDRDSAFDVLLRDAAGAQHWYRNDGHGAFTDQPRLTLHGDLRAAAAIADVDGDGDDDLLLDGTLHRNLGGGVFAASALPTGLAGATLPRFLDLDRDGDPDLVLADANDQPHVLRNAAGTLLDVTSTALPAFAGTAFDLAVTDADRDGDPDLLIASPGQPLRLFVNAGTGTFHAMTVPAAPPGAIALSCGDLDQDGDDDLLAGGQLFTADGLGHYRPATIAAWIVPWMPLGPFTRGTLQDLDQDGRADLVDVDGANGYFHNDGLLGSPTTWHFMQTWFPPFPWGTGRRSWFDVDGDLDLDALAAGARPRLLLQSNGAFYDGVQQPVVVAPTNARPPDDADARAETGPVPFTELALVDRGQVRLLSNHSPPILPEIEGGFAELFMPVVTGATAVALFDPDGAGNHGLVACTPPTVRRLRRVAAVALYEDLAPQTAGSPVAVRCGNLFAGPGDEIVFGATGVAGPQIVARDASGTLQTTVPPLPPAPSAGHALAELVRLADFDGDGDVDLLHELRIVLNLSGNIWSPGADLGGLLPADTIGLEPLDFDGDGRADVVTWGAASALRLWRHTGTAFVDATAAHMPGIAHVDSVAIGDVDRDGDPDLLLGMGTRSDLLRNDDGMFVLVPAVGPRGLLVDVDGDLDADLFDGARIHHNRHCQLGAPLLPSLGAAYRLAIHTHRAGQTPALAWLAVAPWSGYLMTPLASIVRVDPAHAIVAPTVLTAGAGSVPLPIPPAVPLLGTTLVLQALVLHPAAAVLQASNALRETIR